MIRAHAAAIKTRLQEDPVLAGCTFEGDVINRPQRYCTFFISSGRRSAERLTGPDETAYFVVVVHSVGTDTTQSQAVSERVLAQLLNFTPQVAGRECSWLRHSLSMPTARDDTISPALFYGVDEFGFYSRPA